MPWISKLKYLPVDVDPSVWWMYGHHYIVTKHDNYYVSVRKVYNKDHPGKRLLATTLCRQCFESPVWYDNVFECPPDRPKSESLLAEAWHQQNKIINKYAYTENELKECIKMDPLYWENA